MHIYSSLLRAARALLDLSQNEVGSWVGMESQEVSRWETAGYKLLSPSGIALQKAFEKHGLLFVPSSDGHGRGVRWEQPGQEEPFRSLQFRGARALAGLSMREVEKRWGVSRSFLSRLEQQQLLALDLEKSGRLERAYNEVNVLLLPETKQWGAGVRFRTDPAQSAGGSRDV